MECRKIQEQLGFYIDEALDERDKAAVEEHLAGCATCRAEMLALKGLLEATRGIEEIDPPSELRQAIAAMTTQRKQASVLDGLRSVFAPKALRWAAASAGAAIMLAGLIISWGPWHAPTPSLAPDKPAASTQVKLAAPRPAPLTAALAPAPPVSTRDRTAVRQRRPRQSSRVRTVAQRGLPPIPNIAPSSTTTAAPGAPGPGESDAEVYGVDDTTVARTMTAEDIRPPQRAETTETPKLERIPIKVASAPLPKEEEVARWLEDAKTAAEMHRHGNPVGVSVISARF